LLAPRWLRTTVVIQRINHDDATVPFLAKPPTGLVLAFVLDELASHAGLGSSLALPEKTAFSVLDELASDSVLVRGWHAAETFDAPANPQPRT
jgi:hypothetical protein